MTREEKARRFLASVSGGGGAAAVAGMCTANAVAVVTGFLVFVTTLFWLLDTIADRILTHPGPVLCTSRAVARRRARVEEQIRPRMIAARIGELERDTAVPVAQLIRLAEEKVAAAGEFTGDAVVMWDDWPGNSAAAPRPRPAELLAASGSITVTCHCTRCAAGTLDGANVYQSGRRLGRLRADGNGYRFVACGSSDLPHPLLFNGGCLMCGRHE